MKKLLILPILCILFVSCERTVYVDRIIEKPVPKIIKDLEVLTEDEKKQLFDISRKI